MKSRIAITWTLASMGLAALSTTALAADVTPAGWKPIIDVRKTCKIAVPADWSAELSTGYSPGKKISATVHTMKDQSWDEARSMVKGMFAPIKVMQDDGKRLMYSMNPGAVAPGKSGWYVVLNGKTVCSVSFTFPAGSDEALLKKVADTLAPNG
jgi:hypothetical protein